MKKKSVRIRQERLQREQDRERADDNKAVADVIPPEAMRDREAAWNHWSGQRFENAT
jgi:hypothetical protein